MVSNVTRVVIATASLIASLLLLIVPYIIYPKEYVPKANPAMGYVYPNTPATWATFVAALALLALAICAFIWLALNRNPEGSRLSTWPWSVPQFTCHPFIRQQFTCH